MGAQATIKFNAGGRLFETSYALFDQHKETVLGRLVSKTWRGDSITTKPFFIDRDGDIFAQVLNFLRYGSVTLPSSVPKDMFLRDLDYFGISHENGTVLGEMEKFPFREGLTTLASLCWAKYSHGYMKVEVYHHENPHPYSAACTVRNDPAGKEMFQNMLSQYGLTLKKVSLSRGGAVLACIYLDVSE